LPCNEGISLHKLLFRVISSLQTCGQFEVGCDAGGGGESAEAIGELAELKPSAELAELKPSAELTLSRAEASAGLAELAS
jgi:hypothetical protein